MDKERVEDIKAEMQDLEKARGGLTHVQIYTKIYELYLAGKMDEFYDSLA